MPPIKASFANNVNDFLSAPASGGQPTLDLEFVVLNGNPSNLEQKRKSIRAQAARSSAAARKATIVKREAQRSAVGISKEDAETVEALRRRVALPDPMPSSLATSHDLAIIHRRLHYELFAGGPLYYPGLLAALTHIRGCKIIHPVPPILLWIKDIAIRGISLALDSEVLDPHIETVLDISIATLAGWDLAFGDDESLQAHMKALKVLALRRKTKGSLSDRKEQTSRALITSVNIGFIRTIGRDLAILAWKDSDLPTTRMLNELGANTTPSGLIPLEPHLAPVIFNLFLGLAYFNNSTTDASWRLRRYIMQLSAWVPVSPTSKQQPMDAAYLSAHHHARVGLIQLASCLYEARGDMTPYDYLSNPADGRELVSRGALELDAGVLLGTVYEPLLLWCLVITSIASSVRFDSRMRLLASLFATANITAYQQLTNVMSTLAYHPRVLDARCQSLWAALQPYGSFGSHD